MENSKIKKDFEIRLDNSEIKVYKMDLLLYSSDFNLLFICSGSNILMFSHHRVSSNITRLPFILKCGDAEINRILIRKVYGEEFLVALTEQDLIYFFNISSFDLEVPASFKPTLCVNNDHNDRVFHHSNSQGTWSGDLCESKGILALGSNSWRISFIDISDGVQDKTIFAEEKHNIPDISFSPCGFYLSAASISGEISIFKVDEKKKICSDKIDGFGWSVNWITKKDCRKLNGLNIDNSYIISPDYPQSTLEQYLIVGTGVFSIYLYSFKFFSITKQYEMERIYEIDILKFVSRTTSRHLQSLRLCISKKLRDSSMIIYALQNSTYAIISEVLNIDGEWIIKLQKLTMYSKDQIFYSDGRIFTPFNNIVSVDWCMDHSVSDRVIRIFTLDLQGKVMGFSINEFDLQNSITKELY